MAARTKDERGGIALQLVGVALLLFGIVFVAPPATRAIVHQLAAHATMTSSASHHLGERQRVVADGHRPAMTVVADRMDQAHGTGAQQVRVALRVSIHNAGRRAWSWTPVKEAYLLDNHGDRHPLAGGVRTAAGRSPSAPAHRAAGPDGEGLPPHHGASRPPGHRGGTRVRPRPLRQAPLGGRPALTRPVRWPHGRT